MLIEFRNLASGPTMVVAGRRWRSLIKKLESWI